MAKNLTFRLTAEGIEEFKRQAEAAGEAGKAAFDRFAASIPGLGDQLERQRLKAEAMRESLARAAEVNFRNLEASLDPVAAKMRAAAEGAETINTALKAGAIGQGEADRAMQLLAQRYDEGTGAIGRSEAGLLKWQSAALRVSQATGALGPEFSSLNGVLGAVATTAGGPLAIGIGATVAMLGALATRMREVPEYTKEAAAALAAWAKDLESSPAGKALGIFGQQGPSPNFPGTVIPASLRMPGGGNATTSMGAAMRAGGSTPGQDYLAAEAMSEEVALKLATSRQNDEDAAAALRERENEEIAAAMKARDDLDAELHEKKMRRLHEETEAAKRAADEQVKGEEAVEAALRTLDETDRFLSDEKMKRFHNEVQEQVRSADQAARESARVARDGWENFFRYFDHASQGQLAKFSLIGRIALDVLAPKGGAASGAPSLSGMNFGNLGDMFGIGFGQKSLVGTDGIPSSVPITPQIFGSGTSGLGGFMGRASPYFQAGGMGATIGSTGLFGGNTGNASIGGAIGGMAGFAIGGPIGGLVGSLGGSLLGGLFGPKSPSDFTAVANFDGGFGVTSMGGDKPNQNTTGLAGNAAAQVEAAIAQLKGYGVGFSRGLDFLAIGEQRNSYFRLAGDTSNRSVGSIGDAGDLSFQVIKAMLDGASGSSSLRTALGGASNMADLSARGEFVTKVYETAITGAPALTSFENEMKALVETFKDGAEKSREYGLSVKSFTEGFGRSFDENVRMQLLAIQKPLEYSLELWQRDAQARLNAAATVGGNLGQVGELNSALFRQMNAPAISALTGLQSSIGFGSFSSAAPGDQYFSALSAFNSAKSSALSGGDPLAFVNSAQNLLPLARNFLGTSERYGDLSRDISAVASQLKVGLETEPLLQATVQGHAATVSALEVIKKELQETREEQQRTNAVLLALSRRVA